MKIFANICQLYAQACLPCANTWRVPPMPYTLAGALVVTVVLLYLAERFIFEIPYPPGIPLVREPKGARRFSWRTRLAYYRDCNSLFREAYLDYVSKGELVMVPGVGARKELIVPIEKMPWILSNTDREIFLSPATAEVTMARWSLGSDNLITEPWHVYPLLRSMNGGLGLLFAKMKDELGCSFDTHFRCDTNGWTRVDLMPAVRLVVAQTVSRFMVGLPLCRNPDYLDTIVGYNESFALHGGLTTGSPRILQPLIGTALRWVASGHVNKLRRWFLPLLNERVQALEHQIDEVPLQDMGDYLQAIVQFAAKERPRDLRNPETMLNRLIMINIAMTLLTSYLMTNAILDILLSDAKFQTVSRIRREAQWVSELKHRDWSAFKKTASEMLDTDSVARETLRMHAFGSRGVMRQVKGHRFCTEDGRMIPAGTILSVFTQPMPKPGVSLDDHLQFNPFRFSRRARTKTPDDKVSAGPPENFVTTSPDYLPFGHGKRACPGRHVVNVEVKLTLAYLLHHYDLSLPEEYHGQKPSYYQLGETLRPPKNVQILVKKRRP